MTRRCMDCEAELGEKCPRCALEVIADVVLNYRPKAKQPKPRKHKRVKRG